MNYLVQLKLASRPETPQEGIVFIEHFILPTLDLCKRLESEKKIVAGGPLSGAIALSLIVSVESVQELDDLITKRLRTIRSQHLGELCELRRRGSTIRPATAEHRSQSSAHFAGRASHVLSLHRAELSGTWSGFSIAAGWIRDPCSLRRLHRRHPGDRGHGRACKPHSVGHQERMAVQHLGCC
jgi:hypothetical protein